MYIQNIIIKNNIQVTLFIDLIYDIKPEEIWNMLTTNNGQRQFYVH